jgi:hypothetical protein
MASKARRTLKAAVDAKLDQALADSFPASDPVSFIEPAPGNDVGRKPPGKVVGQAKAAHKERGKATRA